MQINIITPEAFTISNFLPPEECDRYIALSESKGYHPATVETGRGAKRIESVRNNDRVLYTSEALAADLWERIAPYVPARVGNSSPIGLNELFRFYKYTPGQRFKKHRDGSYIRNEWEASYYTLLIYLNDGYEGGETTLTGHTVLPEKGLALVFLHTVLHEGTEVKEGLKYVLRTDIMYRTNPE
jgi:prolyl 4-hydroxylase